MRLHIDKKLALIYKNEGLWSLYENINLKLLKKQDFCKAVFAFIHRRIVESASINECDWFIFQPLRPANLNLSAWRPLSFHFISSLYSLEALMSPLHVRRVFVHPTHERLICVNIFWNLVHCSSLSFRVTDS